MFIKKYFRVHAGLFEHEKSWILKNLGPSTTREEHFLIFVIWRKCPDLWHQNLKKSLLFTVFHFFWIFLTTLENLQCSERFKLFEILDFGVPNPQNLQNPWFWNRFEVGSGIGDLTFILPIGGETEKISPQALQNWEGKNMIFPPQALSNWGGNIFRFGVSPPIGGEKRCPGVVHP